jgi:prepilin-type N-terminal cleavage/methylation domain-containing protein
VTWLQPSRRALVARRRRHGDEGFTLIEVVLSLVLLSTLMSSMAVLFVGGMQQLTGLQRRQAAVQVAAQALEAVRAVSTTPAENGCVKLLQGRGQVAADLQWAEAPAEFTTITDEVWTSNLCTGAIVVPWQGVPGPGGTVTDPVVLDGQSYTVRTYIGTCLLTAARDRCLRAADVPAGGPVMYRVLVDVDWTGVRCENGCTYAASTLLDTNADPTFNVRGTAAPVAGADAVCLPSGGPGTINILANDTGSLGTAPVTVVTPPLKGTLAASVTSGVGGYTPSAGASGTDTFTYYLTDVNGQISSTVTVTLTLGGC